MQHAVVIILVIESIQAAIVQPSMHTHNIQFR